MDLASGRAAQLPPRPTPRARPTPRGSAPHGPNELRGQEAGSLLDQLKLGLQRMDADVKQDEQGVKELLRQIKGAELEHEKLKKARDEAARVVEQFEVGVAGFTSAYKQHMENTHSTYQHVRGKHKEAIGILGRDDAFQYHPAYKRHGDRFNATYHTMPQLEKAEEKKKHWRTRRLTGSARRGSCSMCPFIMVSPAAAQLVVADAGLFVRATSFGRSRGRRSCPKVAGIDVCC